MGIHWEKVLTDPLGLAGYALFLVFGVVTLVISRRNSTHRWILPAGFTLATACVLGCLVLAYHRQPVTSVGPSAPPPTPPSMHIDKVDQKVDNGNAVAGVQGNVTITSPPPAKESKPKQ